MNKLEFFTANQYCGSGLKIDLVVVVVVFLVLLSNSTAFVRFHVINIFCMP